MKNKKCCIYCTIAAVVIAVAAIVLIVAYRDEISGVLSSAKEKYLAKKNKYCSCSVDCTEDFADI